MLKAIVFDFDGVLVDSEPLHFAALREIGQTLGVDFDYPQYLAEMVGFDDRDAFDYMLTTAPASASQGQAMQRSCTYCRPLRAKTACV